MLTWPGIKTIDEQHLVDGWAAKGHDQATGWASGEGKTAVGLFSSRASSNEDELRRLRQLFVERNGAPVPSINSQIDEVAAYLGVGLENIDQAAALIALHRMFSGAAEQALNATGRKGIEETINRVVAQSGFDDDAIWNAVFALGPTGVALAEHLVTRYFATGDFVRIAAQTLRDNGGVAEHVALTDPMLPHSAAEQITFQAMTDLALFYTLSASVPSDVLVSEFVTRVDRENITRRTQYFADVGDVRWCVQESVHGSSLILLPMLDGSTDVGPFIAMIDDLAGTPAPWTLDLGKKGAFVVPSVAAILTGASAVPLGAFDALAAPEVAAARRAIRASLEGGGFDRVGPTLYRGVLRGSGDRTQLVWMSLDDQLRILSPIAQGVVDAVPESLADIDFGRYSIETFPPFATLGLTIDYLAGVETVRVEALALARYADECEASIAGDASDEL